MIYKVIHQVNPTFFQVKEISADNVLDLNNQKARLGVTYPDAPGGRHKGDYPAGRFIVRWYTNFGFGNQEFAYALVSYVNEKKGTRTYLECHEEIKTLEGLNDLLNHYANLKDTDAWDLLENSLNRLGMYRMPFIQPDSYNYGLDSGYYRDHEKLSSHDRDRGYIISQQVNLEVAAYSCILTSELYNMKSHIINVNNNSVLTDMADVIDRMKTNFDAKQSCFVIGSRSGNGIFLGTTFKYQFKHQSDSDDLTQ